MQCNNRQQHRPRWCTEPQWNQGNGNLLHLKLLDYLHSEAVSNAAEKPLFLVLFSERGRRRRDDHEWGSICRYIQSVLELENNLNSILSKRTRKALTICRNKNNFNKFNWQVTVKYVFRAEESHKSNAMLPNPNPTSLTHFIFFSYTKSKCDWLIHYNLQPMNFQDQTVSYGNIFIILCWLKVLTCAVSGCRW